MGWVFDRVADGLLPGPLHPLRHLSKVHRHGVLLDVNGKPLADGSATAAATTWRSHHAFSGRCGLCVEETPSHLNSVTQVARQNEGGDAPHLDLMSRPSEIVVSRVADRYRTWVLDFHLRSTSTDPHILLSVAPYYLPQVCDTVEGAGGGETQRSPSAEDRELYEKRMLETPLIWEEPLTLSVDCTATGMYLWSEEWNMFGKKIAETCFVRQNQMQGDDHRGNVSESEVQEGIYEAVLRLSWREIPLRENDKFNGRRLDSRDTLHSPVGPAVVDPDPDPAAAAAAAAASGGAGGSRQGEMSVFLRASPLADEGTGASLQIPQGNVNGSETDKRGGVNCASSVSCVWQRVWQCVLPCDATSDEVYFTPYATLMDGGDEVILI